MFITGEIGGSVVAALVRSVKTPRDNPVVWLIAIPLWPMSPTLGRRPGDNRLPQAFQETLEFGLTVFKRRHSPLDT